MISNFNCVARRAVCSVVLCAGAMVDFHQSARQREEEGRSVPNANATPTPTDLLAGERNVAIRNQRVRRCHGQLPCRSTNATTNDASVRGARPWMLRGPARTDRRGSPATAVSTGGIFGATRVGIGNGRAPLASGAGLFIINKNKFLLISSGLPN